MKWLTLLSATLLFGLTVQAQTGTVSGTITDASGAGVPSATVTLTNLGTAATRTAVTDNSGTYSIPQAAETVRRDVPTLVRELLRLRPDLA
jgi:hypothetical protein